MIGPPQSRLSRSTPASSFPSSASKSQSSKVRHERNTNFKVVIRVRPPLHRELNGELPFRNTIHIDEREQNITVSENLDAVLDEEGNLLPNPGPYTTYTFTFDYCYDQYSSQAKVFETTARHVVDSALQGYNATIFAYGQTGAGKTYTMEGFNRSGNLEERGIIPRAIEQIFGHIQTHAGPRMRFLVRASYLQIYNEQISDLLKPERNNLAIREDKKRGVYVDGLSEWVVRSPAEIYGLMERGASVRATGETKMNEMSSRSHAVFIVIAEQSETVYVDDRGQEMTPEEFQKFMHARGVRREQEMNRLEDHLRQTFKVGKLNLVDLAGSERVNLSGATGQRLEESKQINKSLSMLGFVISALTKNGDRSHIPYRNSKLTRMLEDSLGGNCKTTMMAMISPAFEAMMETISTLKFANRAKNIRNEARVNEDLDQKSLLRKYEQELKKLRAELEERSKNVVDKRRLLELEEQRRRAEADKIAAIKELEAKSLEFLREKEEKKKLEQRIASLMSQMLRGDRPNGTSLSMSPGGLGGANGATDEAVDVTMKQQQEKLRQQYEFKLADLERERENIEEEKAQVDRYKQLLLKQRDIMIALTQRLVERDEQIMALQDELDAYDRHHKEMEEKLDEKTALLIKFQRISMEVAAMTPGKSEELQQALVAWSNDVQDHRQREQLQQAGGAPSVTAPSNAAGAAPGSGGPGGLRRTASGGAAAEKAHATEVGSSDDEGHQHYDEDDIVMPPPPPPMPTSSSSSSRPTATAATGGPSSASSASDRQWQSKVQQQEQQIQVLEQRLAESKIQSTRIERLLHAEAEGYLRALPTEAQRISLRDPLRLAIQQALSKLKDTSSSSAAAADEAASAPTGTATSAVQLERDVSQLRDENQRLKRAIEDQQQQLTTQRQLLQQQQQQQAAGAGRADPELQNKCETLIKEREAVQTIMEHKIKVLVQSVAQATGSLLASLPPEASHFPVSQALNKDVASLQRLVNASIAALRNAAAANGPNNGGSGSGSATATTSTPTATVSSASGPRGPPVGSSSSSSVSSVGGSAAGAGPIARSFTVGSVGSGIGGNGMSQQPSAFAARMAAAPTNVGSEGYLSSYQQQQQQQSLGGYTAAYQRNPGQPPVQGLPEWD